MAKDEKKEKRVVIYFTPSEFARLEAAGPAYVAPSLFCYMAAMQKIEAVEAAGKPLMGGE